jgi:thiamine transport system substrate-binding protein
MTKVIWITTLLLLLGAAAVSAQDNTLTVVAHDSFAYTEEILAQFQEETGITVEVLRLGDAGTMLNQLILSKSNPLGDVVFGVDNTFLSRALNEDLFIAYESPALQNVDAAFIVDSDHNVTPVDYGDVCLNYDIAYFEENGLALPESLANLTKPEYSGLLVVENPATSSPGLAFLMATVAAFGAEGDYTYLDYWTDLVANDVAITEGWTDAYYGEFTRYGGSRPLVVSYASSPPAEVLFADPPTDVAPTGSIVADGTCFRQIEFAGILQGTDNLEAAQQFMDFLLSVDFQEDMPTQMFVFPVNGNAELPEVFIDYAQIPENPVVLDPADIDAGREEWIEAWTETVLR